MSHPIKCEHGVYWPANDAVALSCQSCNPDGTGEGAVPILPRSSGDPLAHERNDEHETCSQCGNIRTYSLPNCRVCGNIFPVTDLRGRAQAFANLNQAGVCPTCHSAVHFETEKLSEWECSDCGTKYKAPKVKV